MQLSGIVILSCMIKSINLGHLFSRERVIYFPNSYNCLGVNKCILINDYTIHILLECFLECPFLIPFSSFYFIVTYHIIILNY